MEKKADPKKPVKKEQDVKAIKMDASKERSKSAIMWWAILGLLCLQAGVYWLWVQQSSVNNTLNQQLIEVQKQVSQQNTATRTRVSEHEKVLSTLKQQQQEVAEQVQTLSENQIFSVGDIEEYWALAEVEYLLNVANQRVVLANDIVGAKTALEMADKRVEELSDYRLHPLRALLAEEQLALAVVVDNDIEGIALQLQSVLVKVDDLQILLGPAPAVNTQDDEERELNSETLQGVFEQAWQEIKSLVVIRHQEDGATPVLVPEQQYFLYQNLRLKLESAQLALLSGKQSVYEENLKSAADWLQYYFVGYDRDAILNTITSLQTQQIAVEIPNISASLTWLQQRDKQ